MELYPMKTISYKFLGQARTKFGHGFVQGVYFGQSGHTLKGVQMSKLSKLSFDLLVIDD
jgi:hypothetical protein